MEPSNDSTINAFLLESYSLISGFLEQISVSNPEIIEPDDEQQIKKDVDIWLSSKMDELEAQVMNDEPTSKVPDIVDVDFNTRGLIKDLEILDLLTKEALKPP